MPQTVKKNKKKREQNKSIKKEQIEKVRIFEVKCSPSPRRKLRPIGHSRRKENEDGAIVCAIEMINTPTI